jgi:hypothetical protein
MRQGQQNNKRMRGRNRKGPNPLTRSFESNGGDVKLRGTALHIAEKYVQLARDAQSSGDRVAAENYFQHAEHYYRIVAAAQAQMPQPQPVIRNDDGDDDDEGGEFRVNGNYPGERQQGVPQQGGNDAQPFVNGASDNDDDGEPYAAQDNVGQGGGYPPRDSGGGQQRDNRDNGGQQRDMGNGGQRFQGQPQGQQRNDGQGHFRRRRPFRDRYENRDRNGNGGGNTGGQGEQGGERTGAPPPDTGPEFNDE